MADGAESVRSSVAGLRNNLAPVGIVSVFELWEQPYKGSIRGGFHRLTKIGHRKFCAAALKYTRMCDDILKKGFEPIIVGGYPRGHGSKSGSTLVRLRRRLLLNC